MDSLRLLGCEILNGRNCCTRSRCRRGSPTIRDGIKINPAALAQYGINRVIEVDAWLLAGLQVDGVKLGSKQQSIDPALRFLVFVGRATGAKPFKHGL